jgi:uncharacterized protein YfaS (alpha-2-macroglobulin family)
LARVLPHDLPHLISVTSGTFSKPSFDSWQVSLDQLAEHFRYLETFPEQDPGKTYYSTVDFGRFLSDGALPQGLFILTLREKEDKHKQEEEEDGEERTELNDSRLVLLTDLGLLVKDSIDGQHDVFAMSFRTGKPAEGAVIQLLGQNGIALFTATAGADGRARFPSTVDFKNEKRPLLYVVSKGKDYSFLPFNTVDRQLNFSRFETGGIFNSQEAEGLRALIFSDRGIYRPGEEAHFGIMVRRRNLEVAGGNIPLELSLRDPRGVEILRRKFALSDLGFDDFRWSSENALTGTYSLGIYLVRESERDKQPLLGSTSFRVDEFQPDKLNVHSRYVEKKNATGGSGWSSLDGSFEVHVQNLFGTPAVDNTVKATLLVRPWTGTLSGFPDYQFNTHDTEAKLPDDPEDLGELSTDAEGLVVFSPDLTRFSENVFRLSFAAEAFEKDSGRSVISTAETLVSSAPYFLGWKADGRLDYISKNAGRTVSFIVVGPNQEAKAVAGLQLKLEQTTMTSALVKQPNGTLAYQLTPKVSEVWNGTLDVAAEKTDFSLRTDTAGDFRLRVFDAGNTELGVVHYQVHGSGNTTFMADRSAEVGIRLNKTSVEPDDDLEVSINTPYTGSGLLTIERDKVYAAQWFHADTLSSVQHIKVPQGIVGNAYVSVAFVRSLDSKEIFASPLSYGVQPFSIARSEYTTTVELHAPDKVKPGSNLEVDYHLSAPGRVLLYAVDEGILQFARYRNPEPVQSFVPKRALEVETYQILDLLLPDQKIVDALSSPGGDEDVGLGKFKNPFARKRRAPMAFWSGILPSAQDGRVSIPIPEYFNGTVRLIAVEAGERRLGSATSKVIAQHDFVIDPQAPYFVSPGDEFEIGATVANTVQGSGKDVPLHLKLVPSAGLEVVGGSEVDLVVPEQQDRSFRLKLKAKDVLGEQTFRIEANGLNRTEGATESISVRPPQALRTSLQTGMYRPNKDGNTAEKPLSGLRSLYPEKREVTAAISSSPLSVGQGLVTYLKGYPYGCTEQLVSSAFPAVLFGNDPELGLSQEDVQRFTKRAFQALSSRQRADGSFGLWDVNSEPDVLFTVYALHFLLEAKAHGLDFPEQVYTRGLSWLRKLGEETAYDDYTQLAQSYALYVRARNGEQVTKEARALVAEMDRQWQASWRDTSIAVFLAGTLKLMQVDDEASALLKKPALVWSPGKFGWPLNDAGFYASTYSWISSAHFPKETWLSPLDSVLAVSQMIESKSFTSFNSAFALLGLQATGEALSGNQREILHILATPQGGAAAALELSGTRILQSAVPLNTESLLYRGKSGQMFFYGLSETGYDRQQAEPFHSGFTIERELRDEKGNKKTVFSLDDKLLVTLFIKADQPISRTAILELIPGGFEIDLSEDGIASRQSLNPGPNTWSPDFIDIQEDRLIFFGDLPQDTATFTYRLKPLSRGKFTFGAAYGEGMYDPSQRFLGKAESVEVQ